MSWRNFHHRFWPIDVYCVVCLVRQTDSPSTGRIYPVIASTRLRAIHTLDNANNMFNCAPFLASPR